MLAALRRAGSPYERAPRELADHTMVTTGAMTKRLDRLAAAGLIVRRHVAGDGRRRVVALTPAASTSSMPRSQTTWTMSDAWSTSSPTTIVTGSRRS
ncbi:MarR family winged helix-turn-helix transcriptional regulator [Cryobacterium sp. 10C3]|uniref:MarR family winged helix-turn-helix transcriptional regulator n=1 Tax=Cryobacterium sp. 10C3 TaxID=3048577 RepID=UPI002AB5BFE5|nr:MarR family transcriptional regulator [Cryobacterium sp. 10C3]MDY7556917.1 MarR family transcriptional regulator [Cryobacterium sp. 10C3]